MLAFRIFILLVCGIGVLLLCRHQTGFPLEMLSSSKTVLDVSAKVLLPHRGDVSEYTHPSHTSTRKPESQGELVYTSL